jgi:hypothetical protein
MPYKKLLEVIVVGSFAGKNRYRRVNPPLRLLALLLSATWPSSQVQAQKFFYLKNETLTGAGGQADLLEGSIPRKAFSDELAASHITSLLMAAHRCPHM